MSLKRLMIVLGAVVLVAVIALSWGCQNQLTGPVTGTSPASGKLRDTGSCTAGSFSVSFSGAEFVTGLGWSTGSSRSISWSGSCSGCNWGPAVYGWMQNPLIEYYVPRSAGSNVGSSYTCNGQSFTLQTARRTNQPSIEGTASFDQYFGSGGGGSPVDMSCHFNAWSSRKGNGSTQNYQVVAAENWSGGSGSASVSVPNSNWYTHWVGRGSATFTCGGGGGGSTTTSGGGGSTTTSGGGGSGNIEAENYSSQSGTSKVSADGGTAVQYSSSSSYTAHNINFGSSGPSSISVRGYYSGSGMSIRFYLDSENGTNFCTVYQSGSGSWFTSSNSCYPIPTGTHTMYVKVSAANSQINWFNIPGASGGGGSTTTTTSGSTTTTTTSGGSSTTTTTSGGSTTTSGGYWWTSTSGGSTTTTTSGGSTTTTTSGWWW